MKIRHVAIAALGLAIIAAAPAAFAGAKDYEFQPVAADVMLALTAPVAIACASSAIWIVTGCAPSSSAIR